MSVQREQDSCRLTIGASRIPSVTSNATRTLTVPDEKTLIKNEDKTLVWRERPDDGEPTVVKMYRRRGFVDWHRERLFNFRVQREYEALCILESAGVPCSAPLFWGFGSAAEHGRFEILFTREIPGAVNLKTVLGAGEPPMTSDDMLPLFDAVRQMHQCGVYHGALYPKNVLIVRSAGCGPAFYLIDLARAIRFPKDIRRTAMARYDLLGLLHGLTHLCPGIDSEALVLRYGLEQADVREFFNQLARYRSTRHLRNQLAFRFQVRSLIANLRAR